MIRSVLSFLLAMLATAPVLAAPADNSVTRIEAAPARDGWFICDGIAGPYAAFAGMQGAQGASAITLLDRRTGRFDTRIYQVGRGDPGAGQIYWSLSLGGRAVGNIHGVNPGMIDDDGATVPPITSMQIGQRRLECRFLAHTRFIGIDSRRSVVITQGPHGLVYQSFDFRKRGPVTHPDGVQRSNRPTLRLSGGSELVGEHGGFRFAGGGYVYFIQRPRGGGAATVQVTRGGRLVQSEKLVGYTYAPPTGDAAEAETAALGPESVWNAVGLDACRAATPAADVDGCLLDTMRSGGASPSAIAFTGRLIADDNPGYVSGWKQAGPIGIATVTYPFRANTNQGTVLVPSVGDPIDVDAYRLSDADKARDDYRAAQANHPGTFPVPPGDIAVASGRDGGIRILVTTPTAVCHACQPAGSVVIGYDFDAAGHFLQAGVVAIA